MAIFGDGKTTPVGAEEHSLYASFERLSGGLLFVLQAVLWGLMYAVYYFLGDYVIAALGLILILYVSYFVFRWPLWRHFYRGIGHIEGREELANARRYLWQGAVVWPGLTVLLVMTGVLKVPLYPMVALVIFLWGVLALYGRVPVDALFLIFTLYVSRALLWLPRTEYLLARLELSVMIVAGAAAVGLGQHFEFMKRHEGDESGSVSVAEEDQSVCRAARFSVHAALPRWTPLAVLLAAASVLVLLYWLPE